MCFIKTDGCVRGRYLSAHTQTRKRLGEKGFVMTGGKDTHTNAHKRIRTQTLIAADRHHNAKARSQQVTVPPLAS